MIDDGTTPATIRCDGCAAEGRAVEARSKRGTLVYAWLPEGWVLAAVGGAPMVRAQVCGACLTTGVLPFEACKAAFAARLEQLGPGLAADIAVSLGVPAEIGLLWAEGMVAA